MGGDNYNFISSYPSLHPFRSKLDNYYSWIIIIMTLFMGLIGFVDDYLKIVKKYSKGLIA